MPILKYDYSSGWFVYANKVLEQNGLPSMMDLLDADFEQAVNGYWSDKILEQAVGKTSMRFMNTQNYAIGLVHLVWRVAGFDIMSVVGPESCGW